MSKVILPLAAASDTGLAGGKAAALARLMKTGFNVPEGFVISTAAGSLGEDSKAEIMNALDGLGVKRVAVRSSAAAEDSRQAAWAGQMDTFLNVSRAGLIEAIKKCQRSGGSARAKAYARQKGLKPGAVAVIVQKMVPSEVSGVAFSVHPVTNDRGKIIIEAVAGLGEQLVSGAVTPDTYILDKKSGKPLERHGAGDQILKNAHLASLVGTVKKIEETFGFPVDVEWAFAKGQLYILQARPITTSG